MKFILRESKESIDLHSHHKKFVQYAYTALYASKFLELDDVDADIE